MRSISILLIMLLLCSCKKKSKFVLEEKSEMAQLMLDMYSELELVQNKIKSNQQLGNYPIRFDAVLDAPMTDESMRSEPEYETFAKALIASEKHLYSSSKDEQKDAYQQVVMNCIACHNAIDCSGPIVKIKKLKWKE